MRFKLYSSMELDEVQTSMKLNLDVQIGKGYGALQKGQWKHVTGFWWGLHVILLTNFKNFWNHVFAFSRVPEIGWSTPLKWCLKKCWKKFWHPIPSSMTQRWPQVGYGCKELGATANTLAPLSMGNLILHKIMLKLVKNSESLLSRGLTSTMPLKHGTCN